MLETSDTFKVMPQTKPMKLNLTCHVNQPIIFMKPNVKLSKRLHWINHQISLQTRMSGHRFPYNHKEITKPLDALALNI